MTSLVLTLPHQLTPVVNIYIYIYKTQFTSSKLCVFNISTTVQGTQEEKFNFIDLVAPVGLLAVDEDGDKISGSHRQGTDLDKTGQQCIYEYMFN